MFVAERRSLEGRLGAYAASRGYVVEYENVPFTPTPGVVWLSCSIISSPNPNYSTIGAVKWIRKHQIFQININIPDNSGAKPAELIAEEIQTIFMGQIQDPGGPCVTFYPAALKSVGNRDGFFTDILSVSYQVDFQESATTPSGYSYTPPAVQPPPAADLVSMIAAVNISANMVARAIGGQVDIASSDLPLADCHVLGVCIAGVLAGATAQIQFEGVLSYNGWSWNTNDPIYLGLNGALTQVPPTTGFLQRIGMPLTATSMLIEIDEPTIL